MNLEPIYLDYAASTPIDERVVNAMAPHHGAANPASGHAAGQAAADLVEAARTQLASLIGGRPDEIVFTSGATEADNIAIGGALRAAQGGHVVTTTTEHKAVLDAVLANCPDAAILQVDARGRVDPAAVSSVLRPETLLVSIMAANNEIGTLASIAEIGEVCRSRGVLFHSDAAQAVGKIPLDVSAIPIDLLSVSAHKMYGPKGVGALWVRRGARDRVAPIMFGGGHERGLRSGTINVAGCVGFGEAASIAHETGANERNRIGALRLHLQSKIRSAFADAEFNGDPDNTLPGIVNVRLPGIDAESLLLATPSVAASTGSACTSAVPEPSHVLVAIGRGYDSAGECIRLSFGRFTTAEEIDRAVQALATSAPLVSDASAGVR
jgi:cysteine desulfurase